MPYLFLFTGILFTVAAVRGTNIQLTALLKNDFTGKNNFVYWTLAILIIGAVGYIPQLKPVSRAFLILVVLVLLIHNQGFFAKFTSALGTTQKQTNTGNVIQFPSSTGTTGTTGGLVSV